MYDLEDVENGDEDTGDPDYQAGGRRRTLVIGRADYCPGIVITFAKFH